MSCDESWAIDRRRLLGAASLFGVAGLPAAAFAQASAGAQAPAAGQIPAGLVTDVRGDAVAELREARRMLAAEGPVFVGDRVETGDGARAGFRLGRATELRLGEKARITIDRFIVDAGGTITLGAGALLVDKAPGSEAGRIRVRSSYGLIAVRGTRFFAGPSNGVFGVLVLRGEVAVRAAGREVVLAAGEGTDIARRGAMPTPARAWGEARIRAALAQVE
ncbi:FecR family protein [Bosea sp. 124]|uniref:FecR family protein n=1 Tax=Bosea sp. 124 TaxID=2135642 RepID=UPI000D367CCA|nr:FecR family protein [Bosea sp. 124]PTM39902.1 FecR family protein [Bosea sp. 124]